MSAYPAGAPAHRGRLGGLPARSRASSRPRRAPGPGGLPGLLRARGPAPLRAGHGGAALLLVGGRAACFRRRCWKPIPPARWPTGAWRSTRGAIPSPAAPPTTCSGPARRRPPGRSRWGRRRRGSGGSSRRRPRSTGTTRRCPRRCACRPIPIRWPGSIATSPRSLRSRCTTRCRSSRRLRRPTRPMRSRSRPRQSSTRSSPATPITRGWPTTSSTPTTRPRWRRWA